MANEAQAQSLMSMIGDKDLSKLSDADLKALQADDIASLSDEGLKYIAGQSPNPQAEPNAGAEGSDIGQKAKELGLKALDTVGRVADYTSGVGRTTAAHLADMFTPNNIATLKDSIEALKGNAPTTAEYLDRAGVPEGLKVSDLTDNAPDMVKNLSVRDLAGFAGDVGLDPATYMTLGGSGLIRGLGQGAKSLGKKSYKSARMLQDADALSKHFNKIPASDILLEKGIWGTNRSVAEQAAGIADKLGDRRNEIVEILSKKGVRPDMPQAAEKYREAVNKMAASNVSGAEEAALRNTEVFDPILYNEAGQLRNQTLEQANKEVTDIYNDVKAKAFDKTKNQSYDIALKKDKARAIKEEVERVVDAASDYGPEYKKVKEELGALLTPKKVFERDALKTKNAAANQDMNLLAIALNDPFITTAKLGSSIQRTNLARTGAGVGLTKAGNVIEKVADKNPIKNKWAAMVARELARLQEQARSENKD